MKLIKLLLLLIILLLSACSGADTMEEAFHEGMRKNKELEDYEIIEKIRAEDIGVILFTSFIKNSEPTDEVKLGYFEENESVKWEWKATVNCSGKWRIHPEGPALYCGTLHGPEVDQVYIGKERAKLVEVDSNRRVWFLITTEENAEIQAVLRDGTERWLKGNPGS